MFENNQPETEDIFSETDKLPQPVSPSTPPVPGSPPPQQAVPSVTNPAPIAPIAPIPPAATISHIQPESKGGWVKSLIIIIVIIVVIGIAASISFFVLSSRSTETPGVPDVSEVVSEDAAGIVADEPVVPAVTTTPTTNTTPTNTITPTVQEPDQDSDGLTDVEEARLGTDPTSSDSDQDGLFDREEVQIYKTDPLLPDTDGDGFLDGEEVTGGYNPLGEGRLNETPTE